LYTTKELILETTTEATTEVTTTEATGDETAKRPLTPREVLFQVFEQGARSSDSWTQSQTKVQALLYLQSDAALTEMPADQKTEVVGSLTQLLKAGHLNFPLQNVLYPLVKELEQ